VNRLQTRGVERLVTNIACSVLHIRTPRVATSRFPCCYSFDIHVDNLIYLLSARIASGEIFTHIFLFFFWYTYNMLQRTSARCLLLKHISIVYGFVVA
jgi:hypothetical protein